MKKIDINTINYVVFDFETAPINSGKRPPAPFMCGICTRFDAEYADEIIEDEHDRPRIIASLTLDKLEACVARGAWIVGHNLAFDIAVLLEWGGERAECFFDVNRNKVLDTMVLGFLDFPDVKKALKEHHDIFFREGKEEKDELAEDAYEKYQRGELPKRAATHYMEFLIDLDREKVRKYCLADVRKTEDLLLFHGPRICDQIFDERFHLPSHLRPEAGYDAGVIESRMMLECAKWYKEGVRLAADWQKTALERNLAETLKVLASLPAPFNEEVVLNSPKQLINNLDLEDKLVEEPICTDKGSISVGKAHLKENINDAELAEKILLYRELRTQRSTFIVGLYEAMEKDNVLHANWNPIGARTGRFTSSPNLQNLPKTTAEIEQLEAVRRCIIPRKGYTFLGFDFSGQETRLIAHFCAKGALYEAYAKDKYADPHEATRRMLEKQDIKVNGKAPTRGMAKTLNFAIAYGMGASGVAKVLGIEKGTALDIIRAFVAENSTTLFRWLNSPEYTQPFYTLNGRRYFFKEEECFKRVNALIQGSAADQTKNAVIRIVEKLRGEDARLVLSVHDELLFEVKQGNEELTACAIKEAMVNEPRICLPVVVDGYIARDNWHDKEKIELPETKEIDRIPPYEHAFVYPYASYWEMGRID